MGSWNETCAITHMPICVGDAVRVMFLTKVPDPELGHAGHCHVNHLWSPRFLSIKATYDDYGNVRDVPHDAFTAHVLESLKEDITHMRLCATQGTCDLNTSHVGLTSDLSVPDVIDVILQDGLWVPGQGPKPLAVGLVLMLDWAYDHLTQHMDMDWRGSYTKSQVIHMGEQWYQNLVTRLQTEERLFARFEGLVNWYDPWAILSDRSAGLDAYGVCKGILDYRDKLEIHAQSQTPITHAPVQELITALGEHVILHHNMNLLRRTWYPQSGKGSQQEAFDLHGGLAQLMVTQAQAAAHRWDHDPDAEAHEEIVAHMS